MKKLKALVLAIILFIISVVVIIINGKTYTMKIDNTGYISDIEEWNIEIQDENVVKVIDKSLENNTLSIKLESISKGKTYVHIINAKNNNSFLISIYVHDFGIITYNEYMGDSNGSIAIPISITIWLIYVLYLLIVSYKQSVRKSMYLYKNIAYLGVIFFTSFSLMSQVIALFKYKGLISTIDGMLNMFSFAIIFFPVVFVVSILVIVSNMVLLKKEGFNLTNMLGLILGTMLCVATITPEIMYKALYSASWIDIHNQNGIGLYIYIFVEKFIFITITYVECVLIGTIIMGVKSAKHIPQLDKDFIIILGCQIRKDGMLTNLLKGRVDKALEFAKMQKEKVGKEIIFVPSGGKGDDEVISEARAMKNYLLEHEIKEENILMEDKSKNTFENIKFSNQIIKEKMKNAKVAFSTTNYHVFRAGNIAMEQSLNMEGIGAKTKSYFWINAFIREFIATIFYEKKKHVTVMCGIVLVAAILIGITYLNNNI
ncbi:MAG: YdcF family protein [Clostridia bacterium]|nr:YdcF family protein [Clostridia bacterium]